MKHRAVQRLYRVVRFSLRGTLPSPSLRFRVLDSSSRLRLRRLSISVLGILHAAKPLRIPAPGPERGGRGGGCLGGTGAAADTRPTQGTEARSH